MTEQLNTGKTSEASRPQKGEGMFSMLVLMGNKVLDTLERNIQLLQFVQITLFPSKKWMRVTIKTFKLSFMIKNAEWTNITIGKILNLLAEAFSIIMEWSILRYF